MVWLLGGVRQFPGLNPKQRREMQCLLLGGAEPHEREILHDGVPHHQTLDGVVQRHRLS
jgi:hypothetical protein